MPSNGGLAVGGFAAAGLLGSGDKPPSGVSEGLMDRFKATKRRIAHLAGGGDAEDAPVVASEGAAPGAKKRKWEPREKATEKKARMPGGLWLAPAEEVNREERVAMNRKIADCAQARDLRGARATLADLEKRGWANGHTYTAAINALCRCGDWQGALRALKRAEGATLFRKGAGITSGLIARTAMLRGLCEGARDVGRARALLERMEKQEDVEARPNVRTANTFLRGCLVLGCVTDAEAVLERMENEWSKNAQWRDAQGGSPDASSFETVVALLCQALRYSDAMAIAKRALEKLGPSPGSAAMFVGIARAAAVRSDFVAVTAAAKQARELLSVEEGSGGGGGSDVRGSGGKRATEKMERDGSGSGQARTKSLEVFQAHRHAELLNELKEVEALSKKGKRPEVDLQALWSRTLAFDDFEMLAGGGAGGPEDPTTAKGAVRAVSRRLSDRFGLPADGAVLGQVRKAQEAAMHATAPRPATNKASQRRKARKKAGAAGEGAAEAPAVESGAATTASEGAKAAGVGAVMARTDLGALFEEPGEVRLELCSGGGEWLCAQALRDSSARWFACELRWDRASRCFQRLALKGLARPGGNAGLVAGDAVEALQRRLLPGCVTRLFVNHPEPPHQKDLTVALGDGAFKAGGDGSEATPGGAAAAHLLTPDFLRDGCASVLRKGGTLTICTDSKAYGSWLLRTLASAPLAACFEDALLKGGAAKRGVVEQEGALCLRTAAPPPEVCGAEYTGEAGASYFQRLKIQEASSKSWPQEEDRYFLCLRRR